MSLTLSLEIVTPDKVVLRCDAAAVTAPGVAGEFTALPLHVPFLSALRIGSLHYRGATQNGTVFVSGGFADVTRDKVLILAEVAELPEEIDVDRARKARERALARILAVHKEDIDYFRARTALERAVTRIKVYELSASGLGAVRLPRHA
ncbi:F0F1 ATP synthase subunit epsilon [Solidesulfovibrio sp.]|uniref:F0F1 ATP synthase subunit epsilon n=1 Tax=Solidesulfovibrio sp. TaxID=2910990 RepID=UPI000EBAF86F|nr:F0F1 ATP synthase subunit epsilon [Solidesulfovibrio sp.]MEA5087620.1 F0F1 ATP synthase subunit epsilon [Solidesulfovibrio sp.]HCR14576.1 F0F1 ATP synthase subunit epsilon [Desulfovibrio sp.]HML61940.1 F0F1 ATP synthase subunit epsilon [Solidesulfovibrio sp.]